MSSIMRRLWSDDGDDNDPFARDRIIRAMQAAGAESPETARTLVQIDVAEGLMWNVLLERGVIREGAPKTYYLYDGRPLRTTRQRIIQTIYIWVVLLLIPAALIYFSKR